MVKIILKLQIAHLHISLYWYRIEYQNRGALHTHMVIWVEDGTMPANVVSAELPRYDGSEEIENHNAQMCREYVKAFQLHNCMASRCPKYVNNKLVKKCRFGFPAPLQEVEELSESKIGYKYVRRQEEDRKVIPHNLFLLLLWNGHVNVQKVTTAGIETYLCKYISKPEKTIDVRDLTSDADRFLRSRIIGILECISILLQMPQCKSTRKCLFLPCDFVPCSKVLKRTQHLPQIDESEDVYYMNLLEKYLHRPSELVEYTYPDFYRNFIITKTGKLNVKKVQTESDHSGDDFDDDLEKNLTCRTGYQKQSFICNGFLYSSRKKPAVVRWRYLTPHCGISEKYYEQLFLLHIPIHHIGLNDDGYPFSVQNVSKTFIEECCIRNLVNAEDNAKSAIIGAIQQGFSVARVLEIARLLVDKDFVTESFVDGIVQPWLDNMPDIEVHINDDLKGEVGEELLHMIDKQVHVEPYETYEKTMTDTQLQLMNWVKHKLQNENQILAICNSSAGTGKSFVTKALYSFFRERNMLCILLATTGSAAHLISGTTVYYYLKLDIEGNCYLQPATISAKIIHDTDVIILDEYSMLSADLLQRLDEVTTSYSRLRNQPGLFGGKHVFLIGDCAQLPAIGQSVFCNPMLDNFSILILKEIVRQKDPAFAMLLNRVRMNEMTLEDKKVLSSKFVSIKDVFQTQLDDVLLVTATRRKMNKYNKDFIDKVEGEMHHIVAVDYDSDQKTLVSAADKASIQRFLKNRWDDLLCLKEGCIVRLLRNIDVGSGWVNSKRARVKRIAENDSYIILQDLEEPTNELPLTKMKQTLQLNGKLYYRHQYPIILGYSSTVHSVQGVTVTGRYFVDLDKAFWESGQAFVSLSRVKSIDQLHFLNTHFEKVYIDPYYKNLIQWMNSVDELCVTKIQRFRGDFPLKPKETKDILIQNIHPPEFVKHDNQTTKTKILIAPFKPPRRIEDQCQPVLPIDVVICDETIQSKDWVFKPPRQVNKPVIDLPIAADVEMEPTIAIVTPSVLRAQSKIHCNVVASRGWFDEILTDINDVCRLNLRTLREPERGGDLGNWNMAKDDVIKKFEQCCYQFHKDFELCLSDLLTYDPILYRRQRLHLSINIPSEISNVLAPVATSGDGRCGYHSISVNLTGKENLSSALKVLLAFKVFTDRDTYDPLFRKLGSKSDDIILMVLSKSTWINISVFFGLSLLLKRSIYSYSRFRCQGIDDSSDMWYCGDINSVWKPPICVAYVNLSDCNLYPNHYVALLKRNANAVIPTINRRIDLLSPALSNQPRIEHDIIDLASQLKHSLEIECPVPEKKHKVECLLKPTTIQIINQAQKKYAANLLRRARNYTSLYRVVSFENIAQLHECLNKDIHYTRINQNAMSISAQAIQPVSDKVDYGRFEWPTTARVKIDYAKNIRDAISEANVVPKWSMEGYWNCEDRLASVDFVNKYLPFVDQCGVNEINAMSNLFTLIIMDINDIFGFKTVEPPTFEMALAESKVDYVEMSRNISLITNLGCFFAQMVSRFGTYMECFYQYALASEVVSYNNQGLFTDASFPATVTGCLAPVATSGGRCTYQAVSLNLFGHESYANCLKLILAYKLFTESEEYSEMFDAVGYAEGLVPVFLRALFYDAGATTPVNLGLSKLLKRPMITYSALSEWSDFKVNGDYEQDTRTPIIVGMVSYGRLMGTWLEPDHSIALLRIGSILGLPHVSEKIGFFQCGCSLHLKCFLAMDHRCKTKSCSIIKETL